ncbi:sigma-54-dependent Fis family transcriptional regulator [Colwellia sp. Bg11-28]|uniref:sigma-54-dependent Fis family transcriptional regulator n=1 Tax=Colwellia sp. Bg11-28 TaxID=2058305 RepID=UPI000C342903|nr:sigma-54-dependent Fis family transcriptional regulator [Colwellia sp. Bg11-28]PKH85468.1 sigma-54-dependent Fis family transcriptional regulator [Colwellia sp. Bg11-28]
MKDDDKIKESWQRCELYGLEQSSKPQLQRLGQSDQSSLDEEYHRLINTTNNEVLPYYENILSNTQCLILLTDNQGQVLNSWGDKRFLASPNKALFEKGVDWKERNNGTNAIGTALACGEAVQIQQDDHFLKANRFMIGSASPIYDVNRTLLGILDISSDAYLPQSHTLGMVKLMSQSIENRLIISTFSDEHFLLTFNTNFDNLDSQWSGIIVFNEGGTIISANRRAEILLCYDLTLVNIADIFDVPLQKLKSQLSNLPFSFRALNKYQMHGFIKAPIKNEIQPIDFRNNTATKSDIDIISLEQFSFGDEKISRCIEQAERIIDKDIPILIHGETGVGKEVFVKGLHHFSQRRMHPLVAVNCAAIPSDLVESELFGYESGAFTGASSKGSIGFIRKAHKGTLFLDEIGEMPLSVQSRLLRVLQERTVTPLGSTESYHVDIKLISATNRSLRKDVDSGQFRQDLYYRVSGLNLELPPLRERTDRKQLFHQVNALYSHGSENEKLSLEIVELFNQHPWPGNVRQLVSVIQIAQAMSDDEPIQTRHLPDDFFEDLKESKINKKQVVNSETVQSEQTIEHLTVEDKVSADKAELLHVYNEYKGNISQTAKALAISRNTLYKRLKEIGIR